MKLTKAQVKARLLEASESWQQQWMSGDNTDGDRMASYLTELISAYFDVSSMWETRIEIIV